MEYTEDDIRDLSIKIVDKLVKESLIKDCLNTDDETEFEFQDSIFNVIQMHFKSTKQTAKKTPKK